MALNDGNNMGFQKKDSGCWDASTDIGSCTEDESNVTIHPAGPPAPVLILQNDFLIEPYEMDVDGCKENEIYQKSGSNKDCGIFMTPESGKPNDRDMNYNRRNSISNAIIGGNLGATGDKGSCKSVTSIMIAPSLGSAESRSSLISGGKGGLGFPGLNPESWLNILRDITIPFFVAGMGMVGAGLLLDYVQVPVGTKLKGKMQKLCVFKTLPIKCLIIM